MLYIGERLGTLNGPKFDIAVDPLEGTKFTAYNKPNAFSVLAVAKKEIYSVQYIYGKNCCRVKSSE